MGYIRPKDSRANQRSDLAAPEELQVVWFADYELDGRTGELRRGGRMLEIRRKPFELLCCLVRNRQRVVSADELMRTVWPDVVVSKWALSTALCDLRRTLGDDDPEHPIVSTRRGRGYQLAVAVTEATTRAPRAGSSEHLMPVPPHMTVHLQSYVQARVSTVLRQCAKLLHTGRAAPMLAQLLGLPEDRVKALLDD